MTGRRPHVSFTPGHGDLAAVEEALRLTETYHLRERPITTLSGGDAVRRPEEVITAGNIYEVYGVKAVVHRDIRAVTYVDES